MYDGYDNSWADLMAEIQAEIKNKKDTLVKRWLTDIRYEDTVCYDCDISDKTMTIYATRPGVLIGKAGVNINELKEMLSDEFSGEWNVKVMEIHGGFVAADR